jgi:hypothetical protein
VPRRAEHHQLVLHPRFDQQIGMAAAALDQPQVEFIVEQLVDDGGRVMHRQPDPGARVAAQEIGGDQVAR